MTRSCHAMSSGWLFIVAIGLLSGLPAGFASAASNDSYDGMLSLRAAYDQQQPDDQAAKSEEECDEPDQRQTGSYYDFLCTTKCLSGDWGGHRTKLEEHGVKFSLILTSGTFMNFKGGLDTERGVINSGDVRANFYFDLDKMGWVPDAFVFFRAKTSWNNGVRRDTGSLVAEEWVYGSGGDENVYVDKWWYGQRFLDGKLEFRIGKLLTPADLFDLNAYAKYPWDQFSNANLNQSPIVPHRKALGIYGQWKMCDWAIFRAAALDADQTDSTLAADVKRALHGGIRYIGLAELEFQPKFSSANGPLPGAYRIGGWYDPRHKTMIFEDTLGGRLAPRTKNNDMGWYLSFDQLLWKETDKSDCNQGLGAFFRYSFAQKNVNPINHFWSMGAQYQGLIPDRNKDVFAFGVAQSIMSSTLRDRSNSGSDRETIYELYYAYHLTPWCIITPDVQYITSPGGIGDTRDSLLGGVRVRISF